MKYNIKKLLTVMCTTLALAFPVAGIGLASETEAPEEMEILSVTAITETQEEGEKFVALAIEYEEDFMSGTPTISSYTVDGRDITKVYVNSSGELNDVQYTGNYVMVELATSNVPGSSLGTTLYYGKMNDVDVKINHRLPVEALITQTEDLTAVSGSVAYGKRLEITSESNPLADQFISAFFY